MNRAGVKLTETVFDSRGLLLKPGFFCNQFVHNLLSFFFSPFITMPLFHSILSNLLSLHSFSAISLHSLSTHSALSQHSRSTLAALSQHSLCTLSALWQHSLRTLSGLSQDSRRTLSLCTLEVAANLSRASLRKFTPSLREFA